MGTFTGARETGVAWAQPRAREESSEQELGAVHGLRAGGQVLSQQSVAKRRAPT